ncbi:MAG: hypothetical protein ACLPLP_20495 [Mycobacterium sp.]
MDGNSDPVARFSSMRRVPGGGDGQAGRNREFPFAFQHNLFRAVGACAPAARKMLEMILRLLWVVVILAVAYGLLQLSLPRADADDKSGAGPYSTCLGV